MEEWEAQADYNISLEKFVNGEELPEKISHPAELVSPKLHIDTTNLPRPKKMTNWCRDSWDIYATTRDIIHTPDNWCASYTDSDAIDMSMHQQSIRHRALEWAKSHMVGWICKDLGIDNVPSGVWRQV